MKKINIKEFFKGVLIILSYFIGANLLAYLFFKLTKFHIIKDTPTISHIKNFLIYFIMGLIYLYIYRKDLKKDLKTFKKEYLKIGFDYWIKGLFIMVTTNLLFNLVFHLGTSVNEQDNIKMLKESFLTEIPILILLAPFIEELVFRKSFYKMSDNKHLYAIISGLIFGSLHVITSLSNPLAILLIIPYSSVGIAFGYLYKKTNNIFASMSMHILHNTINVILILLVMAIGG